MPMRRRRSPAAEPRGQPRAERYPEQGEQHAHGQHRRQPPPEDHARAAEIPGAAAVGDLHAEAGAVGIAEAAQNPGRGAHEADRGGFGGTQPSDHRGVDVAHQAHGELGHDGRERKQQRELELLPPAHPCARPQLAEQYVLCCGQNRCLQEKTSKSTNFRRIPYVAVRRPDLKSCFVRPG